MTAPKPGSALVRFKCDRLDHARRSERYTLTIHEGKWAFCGHEGPTSEHKWRPMTGAKLDELLELRQAR